MERRRRHLFSGGGNWFAGCFAGWDELRWFDGVIAEEGERRKLQPELADAPQSEQRLLAAADLAVVLRRGWGFVVSPAEPAVVDGGCCHRREGRTAAVGSGPWPSNGVLLVVDRWLRVITSDEARRSERGANHDRSWRWFRWPSAAGGEVAVEVQFLKRGRERVECRERKC